MQKTPVLFYKKEQCCGCGACLNKCPREAITMKEDECGFRYPYIEIDLCIFCGRCLEVCGYQFEKVTNRPLETFAAVSKDSGMAGIPAMVGVFAALAKKVLDEGGHVFGATFDEVWNAKHIRVDSIQELSKLQGAKQVQCDTGKTFSETKELLENGEMVLYAGTPCQIAGLYGYLGKWKKYENLVTIDIVCGGVSSNPMFLDYRKWAQEKEMEPGQEMALYQEYASKGWLNRENCYRCKYACEKRPADLTIGTYLGIESAHPEYFGDGKWDEGQDIALVIVNSERGNAFLQEAGNNLEKKASDFAKAAAGNPQLRAPEEKGERDSLMKRYAESGWSGIERW